MRRVELLDDEKPWERARREGWEGVIAKRRGSPYEHRRSKHWLKMKCEASQELVVGGFTDPQGARVGLGALLVGYYEGERFRLCRQDRHRLRHEAPAGSAEAPRRDRAAGVAVYEGHRPAATARALGAPGNRRAGRVHRVDRARQAAASAAARRPLRQGRARRHTRAAVITHPEKVLFPDDGITKGDLAAYYEAMAPVILPHLRGRPVTMERYPAGIGEKGFWQKDVSKGFPAWLQRVEVPKKDGVVHHPVVTDTRSLLWMTNQNTITQHVWTSRVPRPEPPRSLRVRSRSVERRCRQRCAPPRSACAICSRSWRCPRGSRRQARRASTSSFPSTARRTSDSSRALPMRWGRVFVSRAPDRLTQEFSKADRRGRIYVDTGRNGYSATFAAAYTVRAKRGAPVSAPCTWEEVERGEVSPAHVHAAQHARPHREGWRPVGRHAASRAIVETADGKAAPIECVGCENRYRLFTWTKNRCSHNSGQRVQDDEQGPRREFRKAPTIARIRSREPRSEIAWQIVCEEKMIIEALESGKAEWAPPPPPATMKEVLDAYEKQSAEMCGAGRRCQPRAGKARSTSSAASGPPRRWRGAFSSTSFTTAGRSRPTCGRWDRPSRRSTARVRTSPREHFHNDVVSAFGRTVWVEKRGCMRKAIAIVILLGQVSVAMSAAPLSERDRQRLIAHLDMTASWLADEVSGLSPGQLAFRRAPKAWTILEVIDHLLVVAPIYWQDLQTAIKAPGGRKTTMSDADVLWYGIDRTNREQPSRRKSRKDCPISGAGWTSSQVARAVARVRQDHRRRPSGPLRGTARLRRVPVGAAHFHPRTAAYPSDS